MLDGCDDDCGGVVFESDATTPPAFELEAPSLDDARGEI